MTSSVTAPSPSATWVDDVRPQPIRVAVVDDHPLVRDSIRVLLGGELTIRSAPGQGTRAEITVPVR